MLHGRHEKAPKASGRKPTDKGAMMGREAEAMEQKCMAALKKAKRRA